MEKFGNFGQFTCSTKQYVTNYDAAVSGRVSDEDVGEEGDRVETLVNENRQAEDHVVLSNVFKRFKRKLPLRGLSFGVHYGECFGILGVNGSGKTLLFKIVSGE
jgi:ABC-type polysaccharide/polyol phosphate transport system ATPase subunit